MEYSENTTAALTIAAKAHDHQYRKGTNIPYIIHPFTVGCMLQQAGCSEEVIIAGILHDTLEDTDITEAEIVATFGEEVLGLVKGSSEADRTSSWEERKEASIIFLRTKATAEMCMIACADKLDNIRSITRDYKEKGDLIWDRFNRGRAKQHWYYSEMAAVLTERIPDFPLTNLLKAAVAELFSE